MKNKNQRDWEIEQLGGQKKAHEWHTQEKVGFGNLGVPVTSDFGNWVEDKISDFFGKTPKR